MQTGIAVAPAEESSAKLAVVVAAATPLGRGKDRDPHGDAQPVLPTSVSERASVSGGCTFETGCAPLSYSGNPGVNDEFDRGEGW